MKIRPPVLFLTVAIAAAALVTGCSSGSKTTQSGAMTSKAVNATCPYSGEEVNKNVTVAYKDKTVAFCCKDCLAKWAIASDAERDKKLAACKMAQ
jgi:hypothetical protein